MNSILGDNFVLIGHTLVPILAMNNQSEAVDLAEHFPDNLLKR